MLKLKGAVLGKGDSDTLASINNLAVALRLQGKFAEPEGMRKRALYSERNMQNVKYSHNSMDELRFPSIAAEDLYYSSNL